MTKIIEIIVAPDGQTKLQTKGFTGASCQAASRFLEQALGQTVGDQRTAEFYRWEQSQNRVRDGGM